MTSTKPTQRAARRRGGLHLAGGDPRVAHAIAARQLNAARLALHARAFGARAVRIAALTATGLILAAPAAVAQTAQEGYSSPGGNVQSQVQASGPANSATIPVRAAPRTQTGTTSLPFSGLDLIFLLVTGGGLLVVGVALRHITQRGNQSQTRTRRARPLIDARTDQ
jgi:hypothetical protein